MKRLVVKAMDEAIVKAYEGIAKEAGGPFGAAIISPEGKTVCVVHNRVIEDYDPTAHAEVTAIREACKKLKRWVLDDCTIYVTMEPCIMCSGAIVNSRIKKLIIGTKHIKNLNIEKQHEFKIDYFNTCNVEVTFDILKDECSNILQDFFKKLRKR